MMHRLDLWQQTGLQAARVAHSETIGLCEAGKRPTMTYEQVYFYQFHALHEKNSILTHEMSVKDKDEQVWTLSPLTVYDI